MDFTLSLSSDIFNLMSIPLILITIKEVIPRWKQIWDKNLTMEDRRYIMRIVIFLALPAVVFIHELGHLLAALSVGAKVYDFHYGPVTGHVRVQSDLAPWKMLWIAVAGNLAQILVGLISLAMAAIVRSAPLVAFFVYLGLFAVGDTVIFYAALSLASVYGDWIRIYTNPCTQLVAAVGVEHLALIILVLYCMNGSIPRIWFTRKTMPGWSESHQRLETAVKKEPGLQNCLDLSESFVQAGLYKEAERSLDHADLFAPGSPVVEYARAQLEMSRGNSDKAMVLFDKLSQDIQLSEPMRAQISLQMGEVWLYRRSTDKALECFQFASHLNPQLGDARLQKAILQANKHQYDELQEDILALKSPDTFWLYTQNRQTAPDEIAKLENIILQKR